jgi:hypothetical protein
MHRQKDGNSTGLRENRRLRNLFFMDRSDAIAQIRAACQQIAVGVTSIHPLLSALADEPTKSEIVKALFELTKNVEVVKKQVMKLEKRDDSALL